MHVYKTLYNLYTQIAVGSINGWNEVSNKSSRHDMWLKSSRWAIDCVPARHAIVVFTCIRPIQRVGIKRYNCPTLLYTSNSCHHNTAVMVETVGIRRTTVDRPMAQLESRVHLCNPWCPTIFYRYFNHICLNKIVLPSWQGDSVAQWLTTWLASERSWVRR